MDLGIEGKLALVTGASRGLGLGVATALRREGARVAIASRSQQRIREAAAGIGRAGAGRGVLPGMRERGWGRILSLSSSVAWEQPSPVLVLSPSHRAGLIAALKTFARQVGGGVRGRGGVPVLGAGGLHHRYDAAGRRRSHPGRLAAPSRATSIVATQ